MLDMNHADIAIQPVLYSQWEFQDPKMEVR